MIRKATILSLFFVWLSVPVLSQQSLAFQQLKNGTFQSTNYNPAWMPQGILFLGLPAISGVGGYINNRFSYNDVLTNKENGGKLLNIQNVIDQLGINNTFAAHLNINLFHLGVRTPTGTSMAIFANERFESDITYPKSLANWAWNGNAEYIGRDISFSKLGISANYFREYGIAFAKDNHELGVKLGARIKYYQGLVNASTPPSLKIDILTENENFQINLDNKNVTFRTAGIESIQNLSNPLSYFISNGNRGLGVDLGLEKKLNRYYSVAMAVTDIGFISWKEGIKNYAIADTSMRYVGVQMKGIRDLVQTIEDTLISRFGVDENTDAYKTWAVARFNGHFIYTPLPYLDVITSASGKLIQGQPKMGYGVGLRGHLGPKLIASANINRLPQQYVNIGAGLAVSPGPIQFYAAVDKVLGYSVPNMQWAEFKVGLNFVFGNRSQNREQRMRSAQAEEDRLITEPKGVVSGTFMGSKIEVKRSEGLYTIIGKVPPSEARTITPEVDNGAHKDKSIQSATGQNRSFFKKKEIRSATGSSTKNDYKKKEVRSESGRSAKNGRAKSQVRSATGQVYKNDYKKKNVGSATGSQNGKVKKTKKSVRSVSGGAQRSGGKKKTKIRTASGRGG